jgi:hypothetical protein
MIPRSGMVIRYPYLSGKAQAAGERDGKIMPCLIIGFQRDGPRGERACVAPITSQKQCDGRGLPIPATQRRALTLAERYSYVLLTEFNSFKWESAAKAGAQPLLYGFVTKVFREQVLEEFDRALKQNRVAQILREDIAFRPLTAAMRKAICARPSKKGGDR